MVCSVFFNEKVAYDLRNSYWSSDVCASDLSQKEHQAFQRVDVCALYELASAFLGIDHSRLYHDGKVRRKCALRQARSLDELAGRKPVGFMLNQQAEGFEPGGMCQRSERRQRGFSIHASDLKIGRAHV